MATTIHEYGSAAEDMPKLLRYQVNSYEESLVSKVLSCQPWSMPDPSRKKSKKKKGKKEEFFEVLLEDTVLFAEGGGQPTDYGTLNDDINVSFVARTDKGRVLHKTNKSLEPGTEVQINLDWKRRFDHMQQHSSQHLISAIFRNELNAPTISWWMSAYPNPSNIELGNIDNITNNQLQEIEEKINTVIRDAKPMPVHIFYDEKSIEEFANDNDSFKQKKELPAGAGALRVVEIPNVEFNTCCGTHVGNTSQLQVVKLLSATKTKNSVMIEFLAGNRVTDTMSRMVDNERQLNQLLSCGADEHVSNVTKVQTELKNKNSELRNMEKRLIELETNRLENRIINENISIIYEHFERGTVGTFSSIIDGILSNPLFEIKGNTNEANNIIVIMFSIGQSKSNSTYCLGSNDNNLINKKNKKELLTIIDAKGGGKPGRLQGNAKNLKNIDKFLELLKDAMGDRAYNRPNIGSINRDNVVIDNDTVVVNGNQSRFIDDRQAVYTQFDDDNNEEQQEWKELSTF